MPKIRQNTDKVNSETKPNTRVKGLFYALKLGSKIKIVGHYAL